MAIAEPQAPAVGDKGLQAGALGLVGNIVIGLAAVAPAYSLAATLGFVVLAVGEKSPSMFVLAFIPMLLVAFSYKELSQDTPDCGTTFTWGTKAFGPWIGWIGGWGLAVSAIIVLANVAEVAAIYLFKFLGLDDLAENIFAKVLLGSVFIIGMTLVSARGIVVSERIQNVLIAVQFGVLIIVSIIALIRFSPETPGRRRSPRSCPGCGPAAWMRRRSPPPSSCASSSTGAGTRVWPSARRPRTPDAPPASRPSSPR
jgi:amino acid transporter